MMNRSRTAVLAAALAGGLNVPAHAATTTTIQPSTPSAVVGDEPIAVPGLSGEIDLAPPAPVWRRAALAGTIDLGDISLETANEQKAIRIPPATSGTTSDHPLLLLSTEGTGEGFASGPRVKIEMLASSPTGRAPPIDVAPHPTLGGTTFNIKTPMQLAAPNQLGDNAGNALAIVSVPFHVLAYEQAGSKTQQHQTLRLCTEGSQVPMFSGGAAPVTAQSGDKSLYLAGTTHYAKAGGRSTQGRTDAILALWGDSTTQPPNLTLEAPAPCQQPTTGDGYAYDYGLFLRATEMTFQGANAFAAGDLWRVPLNFRIEFI